ncbi:MAG TPA: hypothetical protein VFJ85_05845 [Acidimicrobiales bacterium]|nr:hypothetical protein [Acidimicrobiales bacterium]
MADAERGRLEDAAQGVPWREWGPYVAERAWGTVREDYGADPNATWFAFTYDDARSRTYRWSEDGLAAVCDDRQSICFGLALWNGKDDHLKERPFGLSNPEGNHGEDCKDYWWYVDSTPSHSWMRWRYHYGQDGFPYERLRGENRRRKAIGLDDPEFELADTGVFDAGRYWVVTVDYAKAAPEDLCVLIDVRNAGPEEATLDVLPTLWFRNLWSWGDGVARPTLRAEGDGLVVDHPLAGRWVLAAQPGGEALCCENESNNPRLWPGSAATTAFPKDGINDHVVHGAATVNPAGTGTKGAFRYRLTVAGGGSAQLRLRLARPQPSPPDLGASFEAVVESRREEADAFYASLAPAGASEGERAVMRQALAGLLWSKQYYNYHVARWLKGDVVPPPPGHDRERNTSWLHIRNADVMTMPDKWEFPWYAAWDLAFQCIALSHVDADFAKSQLLLLCREWFMHPNGQLPAFEYDFSAVNPPVHALAALRVFDIDGRASGAPDHDFLERLFHKLLLNFTWWVNQVDKDGNNVFEGGFLGLDNISPFNRSEAVPGGGILEQSDASAWMAMYCLNLLEIALELSRHDPVYEDAALKFFEHFAYIAAAMDDKGLWDEQDGFYYDVVRFGGTTIPVKARTMVGLVALCAVTVLDPDRFDALTSLRKSMDWFERRAPEVARAIEHIGKPGPSGTRLISVVDPDRLRRILGPVLDEAEFLSPYGLRSVSRHHADQPCEFGGHVLRYAPGESTTLDFGGNSNWRGPVWFPTNYLVVQALRRYHRHLGDGFTVACPTNGGPQMTLGEVADELSRRLVSIFLDDGTGRRPVYGDRPLFRGPDWRDQVLFHEYFHGDTGAGLGASHQTGWTGLVAELLLGR